MAGNRVISAVLTLKDKDFTSNAKKATSATKDMERKVKYAGNAVKDFGRSASSSFKSIANTAAGMVAAIGITKALSSAFNMVRSSVSSAFDRIDVMENFERTMTTLTGSAEQAKAALDSAREAVTGTAYGLDVAAKGVQDFVTRGMDVAKATDTMAAWGDAVAFYGDGSNEQLASVSDALAKMYSSGKVQMDQMNRLFDAGIDGVGMYAKAVGRDAGSVQKDLSKGKIPASEFIDVVSKAMMEGTNGVQKIAGAAKEAGASWSGSFANMRAAVTRGVTGIIQSIDEMLVSNGLPDMRSMVAQFGSKFEDVLKKAAGAVPALSGAVVGMYNTVRPGLDWLKGTAFPAVRDELVDIYTSAQPGLNWMKDVAFPGIVSAVGFVVEKAAEMYSFFKDNFPLIVPVVAGVVASVAAFKAGVALASAATKVWAAVTTATEIALGLLNGTLALTPFGWVVLAIGAVVAAGVLLWKNWDTVKEKAQLLWDKTKEVGEGIKTAFSQAFSAVQRAAATSVNFVIDKINGLIGAINKIPGVNVPIVAKVDWGAAQPSTNSAAGLQALESYAVGTNQVKRDMVAQIHKDEMIVPAVQARNLRRQGVTIDNIDQHRPQARPTPPVANNTTTNTTNARTQNSNVFHININAQDRSASDIVNELVPMLKLRLANL